MSVVVGYTCRITVVDVLTWMGDPEDDWCLPEVRGLTRDAGVALLDRAAEVGLLTALGGGYYSIHPALPWYFKRLFDTYYPVTTRPDSQTSNPTAATRAFVEAMGELGNHYFWEYAGGNRDVIGALTAEEANLLHARQLAREHGWWKRVISTMQGLRVLYDQTGRRPEWARLVGEIVPDFVDPATDEPLSGREEDWGLVTEYRVRLAREARQWKEAERLQRICVEWDRKQAAAALELSPDALDSSQRNHIRSLAVSLEALGSILRELGNAECVKSYEEAIKLCQRIGDKPEEAICAFNLGRTYDGLSIPSNRDLAQAERWYQRSLELHDERDRLGRSKCFDQLGIVAWERFEEAREAKRPQKDLLQHWQDAERYTQQALALLPPDAVNDLAVTHNQLGGIYTDAGDLERALPHYRESIRYEELRGNLYGAGETRYNVALALADAGRFEDALAYARAALRNFQSYGDRAADKIQKTQRLIDKIEKAMRKPAG